MEVWIERHRIRPRVASSYDGVVGRSVWLAKAPYMYVPTYAYENLLSNTPLSDFVQLYVHERKHIERQEMFGIPLGVYVWGALYRGSPHFRINEELHAIRAEMEFCISINSSFDLRHHSSLLAGSLYGNCISPDDAEKKLLNLWRDIITAQKRRRE
jgi:hypothetical protein